MGNKQVTDKWLGNGVFWVSTVLQEIIILFGTIQYDSRPLRTFALGGFFIYFSKSLIDSLSVACYSIIN